MKSCWLAWRVWKASLRPKKDKDGRKKGERKHPGVVRPSVEPGPDDIVHDLRNNACPECGGALEEGRRFF